MHLTRQQLTDILRARGVNTAGWVFADDSFETVSPEWVLRTAEACLDALPPALVEVVAVGGGKTTRRPRWVKEAGDCETQSIVAFAWGMVGNWHRATLDQVPRGGLAYGFLFYSAGPMRPENGYRGGRHCICWFVDHLGALRFFEFGDMALTELNEGEILTCTFGLCA